VVVFGNKLARRAKTRYIRENRAKEKQRIHDYYKRKQLLCERCGLCKLSVKEIEENYDEILKRIIVEKNKGR